MSNIFADIDLAIATSTIAINSQADFEHYLNRGVAQCFNPPEKEGRYSTAIGDLSIALINAKDEKKARYYRAYAYFISKDYERAIKDCNAGLALAANPDPDSASFNELMGNIYLTQRKYSEAAEHYRTALETLEAAATQPVQTQPATTQSVPMISSSLLDNYRKACSKAREV
jgi:tetratricopeptide (TPR) repeat protein